MPVYKKFFDKGSLFLTAPVGEDGERSWAVLTANACLEIEREVMPRLKTDEGLQELKRFAIFPYGDYSAVVGDFSPNLQEVSTARMASPEQLRKFLPHTAALQDACATALVQDEVATNPYGISSHALEQGPDKNPASHFSSHQASCEPQASRHHR